MSASISRSERQLILLSAGTAARRQAEGDRGRRLIGEVDWSRFAQELRRRRLLGMLGPRILELSQGQAGEELVAAVEQALRAGRRQGAFFQLISLRAIVALAQAGIRASALKGPLLGEALYGDPGRRTSSDIDLLVAPERFQGAVEVVRGLGYGEPIGHVRKDGLPLLHYVLLHEQGQLPPIELHWRVHWYERRFACERLLPDEPDPSGRWRPEPAEELAALLLFYARDGFVDLRLASDLGAWWDAHGAQLPPGALARLAAAYPALARAIAAALVAAERVVGLPAHEILLGTRRLEARQRLAVQLVNPNPGGNASQLYADMGLIDGLLAPPGGVGAFVRRQLLPPVEVLDQQARHGRRRRARSRVGRAIGVLGRYGMTLARALAVAAACRRERSAGRIAS